MSTCKSWASWKNSTHIQLFLGSDTRLPIWRDYLRYVFNSQRYRFKINFSHSFLLENIETDELRFYHASIINYAGSRSSTSQCLQTKLSGLCAVPSGHWRHRHVATGTNATRKFQMECQSHHVHLILRVAIRLSHCLRRRRRRERRDLVTCPCRSTLVTLSSQHNQ